MKQLLKYNIGIPAVLIGLLSVLLFSCKKQEKAFPTPPKVIDLQIVGQTVNDTLQFVKEGRVIAETPRSEGGFGIGVKITLKTPEGEIQIRRKGQTEIIGTRKIFADKFNQEIKCYYDGEKAYDETIVVLVRGYSFNRLELLIEDRVVAEGDSGFNPERLNIGLEAGKKRSLQLRKKGTTDILFTKEIAPDELLQTFKFYYDGFKVVESVDVKLPGNPAAMTFIAKFSSSVETYKGPVDMVFFQGTSNNAYQHTPTGLRIELPENGTYSTLTELPPLTSGLKYSYKIVKRGTATDMPYDLTNDLIPIRPESGFRMLSYVPGTAQMLDITDRRSVRSSGSLKGTTYTILEKDIVQLLK